MLTYDELLKNRRSIRDYKNKKISPDLLQEILTDTCQAPSAMNQQPWRFIVIQDRALMERISNESKKNLLRAIDSRPDSKLASYKKMLSDEKFNVFYNAPCLVLITGKNENEYFQRDCTLAAAYFMLAATKRNLGTCWIGLGDKIKDAALRKEIGLPDDYEIVASIIIGYPQKIPAVSKRKPTILKIIT